jgi:hypothetical protein
MEDLREVGQKAIASVSDLGAANAGDLVLGIGDIIEELRSNPEQYQERLDHLEGLFREFAFGEGYELRNNRTEELEDEDTSILPTVGAVSGYMLPAFYQFPVINASGTLPPNASNGSTSIGSSVAGIPPVKSPKDPLKPSSTTHPYGGVSSSEEDDLLSDEKEIEELEPEKGYEHKWWKKKV